MLKASLQLYKSAYKGIPKPVWLLSLVMLVNRSGTMVIPFLTVYLVKSGFTLTEAGIIMAIFGCGAIIGGFLGGRLTDSYGFFNTQLFSLLFNGVFFIVLGFMNSFWEFAWCIFLLSSLGEAFRPANAAAIAAYSNEINRTRCYSLNRLATNLGWAIGPAVGGLLAAINFKLIFWVDGITCIFASVLLYFFLKEKKDAVAEPKPFIKVDASIAYRDVYFLKGMFYMLLIGISFFQLFSILPVFYRSAVHLNEQTIGLILALNGLIIVVAEMILVYKLEGRKETLHYMMMGSILMGLSFITLIVAPSLSIVLISMVIITFGEMFLFPFANIFWVNRSTSQTRGQYAAVYTMTFAVSHVVAPLFASYIAMHYSFATLFVINFCLCSVAAAGFIMLQKKHQLQYERI